MALTRYIATIFLFILIWSQPVHANEAVKPWRYSLGEGLRIADTDFYLGGYMNIEGKSEVGGDGELAFDELSLFIFGNISDRWRFFSELEEIKLLEVNSEGESRSDHHGEIERLYVDYLASEKVNIRVGKFLTPIGTWNEIHAEPLTWTVSRPLVTFVPFPVFITGVQAFGDLEVMDQDISYSLFYQGNESIDEETGLRRTHIIYGGRGRWHATPNLEIGVPLLYYKEYEVGDKIYLSGLDFTYKTPIIEVRGEATYSGVDREANGWSDEYGYYIQGAYGLTEKLFLVVRHEYFKARGEGGELEALSIGGAYKPRPQIVFKAEYQTRNGDLVLEEINDSEVVLASFSVLF